MRRYLSLGMCLMLPWTLAQAEGEADTGIYRGSVEQRVDALAGIQPGLGAVMNEIGTRFANLYWAANGGNWGLAQYQLKELLEAQEVAEVTRPARAPMLKAFEQSYLEPLAAAIKKKDLSQFNPRFAAAEQGCNACHTALGYGFIRYHAPKRPPATWLNFTLKTSPSYDEKSEAK